MRTQGGPQPLGQRVLPGGMASPSYYLLSMPSKRPPPEAWTGLKGETREASPRSPLGAGQTGELSVQHSSLQLGQAPATPPAPFQTSRFPESEQQPINDGIQNTTQRCPRAHSPVGETGAHEVDVTPRPKGMNAPKNYVFFRVVFGSQQPTGGRSRAVPNIPPQSGVFTTLDEPAWTHRDRFQSLLDLRVHHATFSFSLSRHIFIFLFTWLGIAYL